MRLVLTSLLLSLGLPATAAPERPAVDVLVYANPGVFDVGPKDQLSGDGVAVMQRLSDHAGVDLRLQVMPAMRALAVLPRSPGHCIVGLPRTPDREALFRWVGVIASGAMALYARAGDTREVNSPEDLRQAVIVAQRASRPLAWLRDQGLQAYEVNDTSTGLRMLRAARVDYWLVNDVVGERAVRAAPQDRPRLVTTLGRVDVYLACHRALPDEVAERLGAGLETLRREGALAPFGLK